MDASHAARTAVPQSNREKSGYRPEIDGLRAVAVVSVICFHARFTLFGRPLLSNGYLGVDVFFVISGYLIGRFILAELDQGTFSLVPFYERRARRILPALLLVLIASFLAATLILTPKLLVDFSGSLAACLFFIANIFFWIRTDYFAEPSELTPLLHMWSLSVEEQFYLVFPLILILLMKHTRRMTARFLIAAAMGSLGLAFHASVTDPSASFYLFQHRAWELLVGVLVAIAELNGCRKLPAWVGAALPILGAILILKAFTFSDSRSGMGTGSILAVAGATLVIWGDGGPVFRLLTSRAMVGIGLISYSLYLWHQPLFAFARIYAVDAPRQETFALLSVASIVLAALSWRYVEQPFRKSTVSPARFAAFATTGGVTLTAASLIAVATGGLPARFTSEQLALLNLNPERGAISINGRPCTRRSIADACLIGDTSVAPKFALLGDSHAETLTGPLDAYFRSRSVSAYVYTNAGCPFIAKVVDRASGGHCDQFTDEALSALKRHHISRVIVNDRSTAYIVGSRFDNTEGGAEPGAPFPVEPIGFEGNESQRIKAVAALWQATMRRLIEAGTTVYYVLPVPEVGWHVPRTLVKRIAQHRLPLTTSLSLYLDRHRIVLDMARQLGTDGRFVPIYPHEVFCSKISGRCATHEDQEVFYTDTDHLSREGAKRLVAVIARKIDEGH